MKPILGLSNFLFPSETLISSFLLIMQRDSCTCEVRRPAFTMALIVTSSPSLKRTWSLCGSCVQKFKPRHRGASPYQENPGSLIRQCEYKGLGSFQIKVLLLLYTNRPKM